MYFAKCGAGSYLNFTHNLKNPVPKTRVLSWAAGVP
nr:MAG TPA: Thymidine kinase from Herpesvirus C-terminal [Caudoviricetes sp.]